MKAALCRIIDKINQHTLRTSITTKTVTRGADTVVVSFPCDCCVPARHMAYGLAVGVVLGAAATILVQVLK